MEAEKLRYTNISGFLVFLILSTMLLFPNVVAQEASNWSDPVSVPTGTVAPTKIITVTNPNGDVGAFWTDGPTSSIGFSLRSNATGLWTLQNADITGATGYSLTNAVALGNGKWGFIGNLASTTISHFWNSVDNGVVWNDVNDFGVTYTTGTDLVSDYTNGVALAGPVLSSLKFQKSADNGDNWDTTQVIDDNKGAPGVTGGSATTANSASIADVNNQFVVTYTSTTDNRVYQVESDDGLFWTVPYSTTVGGPPVDGGTIKIPIDDTTDCPRSGGINNIEAVSNLPSGFVSYAFSLTNGADNYACVVDVPVPSATPGSDYDTAAGHQAFVGNSAGELIGLSQTSTGDLHVFFSAIGSATFTLSYTVQDKSPTDVFDLAMSETLGFVIYRDASLGNQLREIHASVFLVEVAQASLTLPNIHDFAVDISGTNLIIRNDVGGSHVSTYSAQSLENIATLDTNCNQLGGITAGAENVAYVACSDDALDIILVFDSPSLDGSPVQPGTCDNAPPLASDLINDVFQDIHDIQTGTVASIDFNMNFDLVDGNNCAIIFTMAFTTFDGKVGVLVFFISETDEGPAFDDEFTIQYAQYSNPSAGINDYCFGDDQTDETELRSYLVAVSDSLTTRTYELADGDFRLLRTASGVLGSAFGVSCGSTTRALLMTGDKVWGYNYVGGSTSFSHDISEPTTGGVAVSWDGKFGAYWETGLIHILNMTTGNETFNFTGPDGSFVDMKMDSTAQSLWVLMDNSPSDDALYRFDIVPYTTIVPVAPGDRTPTIDDPDECTACGGDTGGGAGSGFGVFNVSRRTAIFGALGTVAVFLLLAYAVSTNRKEGDNN